MSLSSTGYMKSSSKSLAHLQNGMDFDHHKYLQEEIILSYLSSAVAFTKRSELDIIFSSCMSDLQHIIVTGNCNMLRMCISNISPTYEKLRNFDSSSRKRRSSFSFWICCFFNSFEAALNSAALFSCSSAKLGKRSLYSKFLWADSSNGSRPL